MKSTSVFIFSFFALSVLSIGLMAQPTENNFIEIEKALKTGDLETLSIFFSDTVDIDILGATNICSKNQAKQILKNFFVKYTPKNFTFIHQSGNSNVQYGIGLLIAGGESFRITIFIQNIENKRCVQQIRIEKTKN